MWSSIYKILDSVKEINVTNDYMKTAEVWKINTQKTLQSSFFYILFVVFIVLECKYSFSS